MIESYDVLRSSYRHKLIYKVSIIKNSNQSQPLQTRCLRYEWWVNRFKEVKRYKTLSTVRLKKRVINDVTTAVKTFRAERQYDIR